MMKKTIAVLLILAVVFTAGGVFMRYSSYAMGFGGYYDDGQQEGFYRGRMPGRSYMNPYWDDEEYRTPVEGDEDVNVWPYRGYQYPNHPMWRYFEDGEYPQWEDFDEDQGYFRGCHGYFYRDEVIEN